MVFGLTHNNTHRIFGLTLQEPVDTIFWIDLFFGVASFFLIKSAL